MIILCAVGMEWEVKTQNVLVIIIGGAIIDFVISTIIGAQNQSQLAKGFIGPKMEVFEQNLWPDYRFSESLNQKFLCKNMWRS